MLCRRAVLVHWTKCRLQPLYWSFDCLVTNPLREGGNRWVAKKFGIVYETRFFIVVLRTGMPLHTTRSRMNPAVHAVQVKNWFWQKIIVESSVTYKECGNELMAKLSVPKHPDVKWTRQEAEVPRPRYWMDFHSQTALSSAKMPPVHNE